jgi:hypothetical protein
MGLENQQPQAHGTICACDTTRDRDAGIEGSKTEKPNEAGVWGTKLKLETLTSRKDRNGGKSNHAHAPRRWNQRPDRPNPTKGRNKNETRGDCFHEKIEARTERSNRTKSDRQQPAHIEQKRIFGWLPLQLKEIWEPVEKSSIGDENQISLAELGLRKITVEEKSLRRRRILADVLWIAQENLA